MIFSGQRFRTRGEPPDADFRDNFLAEIMGGTRENEKLLLGYFKEKFDTHSGTLRKDEVYSWYWLVIYQANSLLVSCGQLGYQYGSKLLHHRVSRLPYRWRPPELRLHSRLGDRKT